MESKFYIGQKIVALYNHQKKLFKKGDVFEVLQLKKMCCQYGVKIFNENFDVIMVCSNCNSKKESDAYFAESFFAPMQEISNMTYKDEIELVTEKQLYETN